MKKSQKSESQKQDSTTSGESSKSTPTVWEQLAAPFAENEIEWRAGATNKDKTKCLALPYVTNRAIQNRLDRVLTPEGWQVHFKQIEGGFVCTLVLKVNGEHIVREDGASSTNFEPIKGGISDAMKRAAVQFGIGRYLYDAEATWVTCKAIPRGGNKPPLIQIVGTPKLTFKGKQTVADAENIPVDSVNDKAPNREVEIAIKKLRAAETIDELKSIFMSLKVDVRKDAEVVAMKDELKMEFENV